MEFNYLWGSYSMLRTAIRKRLLESKTEAPVGNLYKLKKIVCECFTSVEVHMNYVESIPNPYFIICRRIKTCNEASRPKDTVRLVNDSKRQYTLYVYYEKFS